MRKKKLSKECWSIDYSFIKWLNKHLKVYLKEASEVIDLEWKEYEYCGKIYTLKSAIERMIYLSDKLKKDYYVVNDVYDYTEELLDLFKLVFNDLWW